MSKSRHIILWEAPRSRGTALSFSLYNGLRQQAGTCQHFDEPFHPMRAKPIFEKGGLEAVRQYHSKSTVVDNFYAPYVLQKRLASWIYDPNSHVDLDNLGWIGGFQSVFLLRRPEQIIASYRKAMRQHVKKFKKPEDKIWQTMHIIGIEPLYRIFKYVTEELKTAPIVVDTGDIFANPKKTIPQLTEAMNIPFHPAMLVWDKVDMEIPPWGAHWYKTLLKSKGLFSQTPKDVALSKKEQHLAAESSVFYEELSQYKLSL